MSQFTPREEKAFSIVRRAKSFSYAFRGIMIFLKTQHNAWVEILVAIIWIYLGLFFQINTIEWMMLVFAIGSIFVSEAFNTALEIDIDLTSPSYHPFARDTKDVAAGAVLLASLVGIAVVLMIFLPKIIVLFNA